QGIGGSEDRRVQGACAGGSADDDGTRREANPSRDVDPDPKSAHRLSASKTHRASSEEPALERLSRTTGTVASTWPVLVPKMGHFEGATMRVLSYAKPTRTTDEQSSESMGPFEFGWR